MGPPRRPVLEMLRAHLEASRRRRIEREVAEFITLLAGIRDPEIQFRRFAEHLDSRSICEAATLLACLVHRLACRDEAARALPPDLLDAAELSRLLGERWVEEVRADLDRQGDPAAALLLQEKREGEADAPLPREPVGFRIALARQPARRLVERLLFDPDPRVVRVVLGNPRLTEGDVVRLAASRRAVPQALEAIAADRRWAARYAVKLALASNPVTPSRVAVGLLPHLLRQDLRDLSLTSLRAELRDRAAALLARRE